MDIFEAIHKRRSIRKFLDTPVPYDSIVRILFAGLDAPSPGNLHNYKIIVVMQEDTIKKLAEAALQQSWIETAKAVFVLCDEPEKAVRHYSERGKLYSVQGCAAVAENMLLAAQGLGLGACWVGAFEEDMVKRALGIPGSLRVQTLIPIGYPDEVVPKPQRPLLEKNVYVEAYWRRFDFDKATGYWSSVWEEKAKKTKKAVEKKAAKAEKELKKEFKGIGKKIKEKISELKEKVKKE